MSSRIPSIHYPQARRRKLLFDLARAIAAGKQSSALDESCGMFKGFKEQRGGGDGEIRVILGVPDCFIVDTQK